MFTESCIYYVCREPGFSLTLLVLCGVGCYYINSVFPAQKQMNSMWTGGPECSFSLCMPQVLFVLRKHIEFQTVAMDKLGD